MTSKLLRKEIYEIMQLESRLYQLDDYGEHAVSLSYKQGLLHCHTNV